jgi:hypothetical protein
MKREVHCAPRMEKKGKKGKGMVDKETIGE